MRENGRSAELRAGKQMWQVNQQRIGAADPVAVVAYSTLKQCTLEKRFKKKSRRRRRGAVPLGERRRKGELLRCCTHPTSTFQFTNVPSSMVGDNAGISTTICSGRSAKGERKRKKKDSEKKREEKERRKQEKTSRRKHVIIKI